MTTPAIPRRQIAVHEAGHAVSALRSGFALRLASIEPYGKTLGVVERHPPAGRAVLGFHTDRQGVVICLSGPAAELLHCGGEATLVYADGALELGRPKVLCEGWHGHLGARDLADAWAIVARGLCGGQRAEPAEILEALQFHWDEARGRLVEDWKAVEAIAGALVRYRTLTGPEAAELYQRAGGR